MIGPVALKTLNVSAVINYTVGDFRNIPILIIAVALNNFYQTLLSSL